MGSTLIQGSDFHFNFLLSGVDVCGEWHGGPTARPCPSPHYLLMRNPGDLGSATGFNATPAGRPYKARITKPSDPEIQAHFIYLRESTSAFGKINKLYARKIIFISLRCY